MKKTDYVISTQRIFCRKVSVSLCPWWVMEWVHRPWCELWMCQPCDDGWRASATGLPWKTIKKMSLAGSGFDLWASNYINSRQGRLLGRTVTLIQGHTWLAPSGFTFRQRCHSVEVPFMVGEAGPKSLPFSR